MTKNLKNLLALVLLGSAAPAQVTLLGAGYSNPTAVALAPGQVTTLFVSGLSLRFPAPVVAPSTPLPTTLGGISVRFRQGSSTYFFAIFSIQQTYTCISGTTNECYSTGITVQVPFEVNYTTMNAPTLVISVNGVDSQSLPVALVPTNTHILTSCDSIFATASVICLPEVTHANGGLASVYSKGIITIQASAGETIVVYATGLGITNTAVATGTVTPTPAPQVQFGLAQIGFLVSPNVGATYPWLKNCPSLSCPPIPALPGQPAASAWLVPGEVGLYQINITLPTYTATDLPTICEAAEQSAPAGAYGVYSNVTITIFDGVGLASLPVCISPR